MKRMQKSNSPLAYFRDSQKDAAVAIRKHLSTISRIERQELISRAFCGLGPYDNPIRELEHLSFTFECVLDQGAYYDIKRHRMMTQSVQDLGTDLGYTMPLIFREAELESDYHNCMEKVISAFREISSSLPIEASYLVPNAFRRQFLITLNLRELFVLCKLRAGRNGHFAYRRFAMELIETVTNKLPFLGSLLPKPNETSQQISDAFFAEEFG